MRDYLVDHMRRPFRWLPKFGRVWITEQILKRCESNHKGPIMPPPTAESVLEQDPL